MKKAKKNGDIADETSEGNGSLFSNVNNFHRVGDLILLVRYGLAVLDHWNMGKEAFYCKLDLSSIRNKIIGLIQD